jgi:hypothetical protein
VEPVPFLWGFGTGSSVNRAAHALVGEPVSTSPEQEHALMAEKRLIHNAVPVTRRRNVSSRRAFSWQTVTGAVAE